MKLFNFEKVQLPTLKEIPNKSGYYSANYNNKFFLDLIEMYEHSSLHKSIIDNKSQRIYGSGFVGDTEMDITLIKNLGFNDTYAKSVLDYELFNGFALEVIWNSLHTKIVQINHLDFSKVRSGMIADDEDEAKLFYYCNDWSKKNKEIEIYHRFDKDVKSDNRQIYYFKHYHPGSLDIYPRPSYYSLLEWIYIDIELASYYSSLVKNNFVANTIISVNNGIPDPEIQVEFERGIKNAFTSSENAGSILVLYSDSKENAPEIIKFNNESDDAKYQFLMSTTTEKIISGEQIPNPLLAGIKVSNGLGNSGEELKVAETIYNKVVIQPRRADVLSCFNELNDYLLQPINYTIKNNNLFLDETIS